MNRLEVTEIELKGKDFVLRANITPIIPSTDTSSSEEIISVSAATSKVEKSNKSSKSSETYYSNTNPTGDNSITPIIPSTASPSEKIISVSAATSKGEKSNKSSKSSDTYYSNKNPTGDNILISKKSKEGKVRL